MNSSKEYLTVAKVLLLSGTDKLVSRSLKITWYEPRFQVIIVMVVMGVNRTEIGPTDSLQSYRSAI